MEVAVQPLSVMKALTMGGQQAEHFAAVFAHFFIRVVVLFFQQHRAINRQRAATLGIGAGGEQHLAHVGVNDDRVGRFVLCLGAAQ
jgi:hypothetical protein